MRNTRYYQTSKHLENLYPSRQRDSRALIIYSMKSYKKTFQTQRGTQRSSPKKYKGPQIESIQDLLQDTLYQIEQNHRQQDIKAGKRKTASYLQRIFHQVNNRPLIRNNANKERMGKYIQSVKEKAISTENTVPSKIIIHLGRKDTNIPR